MHAMHLQTARATLRPIGLDDTDALHTLFTSAGVRRFLWDDEIIPLSRTQSVIELSRRCFDERRHGLWGAWTSAEPSTLVGFAGLLPFRDPPELELVYGLAEPLWGNGLAPEYVRAVLAYLFDDLAMPIVRASTDVGNVASMRVVEKLGFRAVDRRVVGGLDTVFFELSRTAVSV